MKLVLTVGVIVLAIAGFIYGVSRTQVLKSSASASSGFSAETKSASDFELKSLDGRVVKLSDFRGKVVLLNFWATYCSPCRVEMPWLVDLYKQYQGQDLEIVGVSMDDDGEQRQVADFVREINVNYTILLGTHAVGDAYGGTQFLPRTLFIDRAGNITSSAIGLKSKSDFESAIKQLLLKKS